MDYCKYCHEELDKDNYIVYKSAKHGKCMLCSASCLMKLLDELGEKESKSKLINAENKRNALEKVRLLLLFLLLLIFLGVIIWIMVSIFKASVAWGIIISVAIIIFLLLWGRHYISYKIACLNAEIERRKCEY